MPQSSNHLRLVSWTWQWVHFTQMASTVTRSQSNRAPLGCGGTGDSHHGCAADKSAATVWCYHVNMDQNHWGMFPTPCWICHEELRPFWRQNGVQPSTSKMYLIKWSVSVYVCMYVFFICVYIYVCVYMRVCLCIYILCVCLDIMCMFGYYTSIHIFICLDILKWQTMKL